MSKKYILVLILSAVWIGCGDDGDSGENNTAGNNTTGNNTTGNNTNVGTNDNNTNSGTTGDNNTNNTNNNETVVTVNNVNNPPVIDVPCFDELKEGWPLNEGVNAGAVTITEAEGVFSGTIDAASGGSMAAASSSFLYVDLDTGAKVEVDDFAAYENTEWDLAFKRVLIRTNSSSSGIGAVELGKVADTTFEEASLASVTTWATDDTMDATCIPDTDPINNLITAFNLLNLDNPSGSESWYSYAMGISTQPDVYFVKNAEGTKTFKFAIDGWASGVYTVKWEEVVQ